MTIYAERREKLFAWLAEESLDAVYLTKDPDVRYFTGMPSDSVLVLLRTGRSLLLPWDINLARLKADADEIIPYTQYGRNLNTALKSIFDAAGIGTGGRIEIPGDTSCPAVAAVRDLIPGAEWICRSDGLEETVHALRTVKDPTELAILRKAASITNEILGELEEAFAAGTLTSELDIALFLERASREKGAEGTGFETIAAGPSRSNGIHAFPTFTGGPFAARGCGIIDFGVKVDGYTSDVTVTTLFGEPTAIQSEMIDLVQRAYDEAVAMAVPGADAYEIARHVDSIFESAGYSMPHSLGHGVGLEVHEAPLLRSRSEGSAPLRAGMVFTIEPGLYHPEEGGVRLENDIMLTDTGAQIITSARILRFPDPG